MLSGLQKEIIDEMHLTFSDGHGYKISDGHFEIGKKLHSENYYFVKNFFQNRRNCQKVSELLSEKLVDLLAGKEATLIGFGNYSANLLSIATEGKKKWNYAVIESDGESYAFRQEPDLHSEIIIILPVTCSGATYFKLRRFIEVYLREHQFLDKQVSKSFLSIFLIIDEKLRNFLDEAPKEINELTELDIASLYTSMGWKTVSNSKIDFEHGQVSAYPILLLETKLYSPEKCPRCFPELEGKALTEEKLLFSTNISSGTPNLIFNMPNFNFPGQQRFEFDKVMGYGNGKTNPHLFGNIQVNNNSYQNFIRGNIFYENNKEMILEFFSEQLSSRLTDTDEVVFVSHDTRYSSLFLEDISRATILKDKKITILRYQPSYEFVDNFIAVYRKILNPQTKIIYYEDVLSGAWTFKITSDYIKYAKQDKTKNSGFDMVLTLVDRTSNFTEDEILRKLSKGLVTTDDIISFFKLNVPIFGKAQFDDPIKEKFSALQRLIEDCHLDALKMVISDDLRRNKPKNLNEIVKDSMVNNNRLYLPISGLDQKSWEFYSRFCNEKTLNYVRLYLTHEINAELSKKNELPDNAIISKLIKRLKNPLNVLLSEEEQREWDMVRDPLFEKRLCEDIIVSILAKPPFTYYEKIYKSVFEYCLENLYEIDSKNGRSVGKQIKAQEFIQLKNAIKRSVEMNSNYILSENFIANLKYNYEKEQTQVQGLKYRKRFLATATGSPEIDAILKNNLKYQYRELISYNYFLLYCYKKLLFNNPGRSLRLEELLNSDRLSPQKVYPNMSEQDSLIMLWRSSYHLFHRILKAENISILKDLKDFHLQLKRDPTVLMEDIFSPTAKTRNLRRYYFEGNRNDVIINTARNFIAASKSASKGNIKEIQNATCAMLRLMNILTAQKNAIAKTKPNATPGQSKLNQDARLILDEVLNIFQPGEKRNNLNYAFFIEYKEPDTETYNLHPILSKGAVDLDKDYQNIKLDKKGLIYQSLYGLTDTYNSTNPQTLLFAGKFADECVYSFQDDYFGDKKYSVIEKPQDDEYLNVPEDRLNLERLKFTEMYALDHYDERSQMGLRNLSKSNMTIIFRLSDLREDTDLLPGKLRGQAVLVITNTDETTIENFSKFMDIEKIRLLLLVKEDLLGYLQELFDNDAFIEIIENKRKEVYQSKLEHGINRYLEAQHSLFNQVINSKNPQEIERRQVLYSIIKRAIQAQIKFKENFFKEFREPEHAEQKVNVQELLKVLRYIFESGDLGNYQIPFETVDCKGFSGIEEILMHESILYIVIPEILINMKKYSSRLVKDGLGIEYDQYKSLLIFRNDIKSAKKNTSGNKNGGGKDMCGRIIDTLKYHELINDIDHTNHIHTTILNLNKLPK